MTTQPKYVDVIDILDHFDTQNIPNKALMTQISQPPKRFFLTTFFIMLWMGVLLAIAPMVMVSLPDPVMWFSHREIQLIPYTFQVPMVILLAGILGQRLGTLALLLFLSAGFLGAPVFAGGGGMHYLYEMTAGYLLGFLLVPWTMQRMLGKAFCNTGGWFRGRSLWLALAAVLGVGVIHACGAAGLGVHVLMQHLTLMQAEQWWLQMSWPVLLYDIAFGWAALGLVRLMRLLLWLCLY